MTRGYSLAYIIKTKTLLYFEDKILIIFFLITWFGVYTGSKFV